MFIIQIPFLDLNQTAKSGQHLRWILVNDNKYIVVNGSKAVKVQQFKDNRFCFDCPEEEFYSVWYDYFDVSSDYLQYNYTIKNMDEYFSAVSVRARGVRIVKQDIFEVLIASIIDDYYDGDTDVTDSIINDICKVAGMRTVRSMREAGRVAWYTFPTHGMLLHHSSKIKLIDGMEKELYDIIISVCLYIKKYGYKKLPKHLRSLGVSEYAFYCINLYSFHKLQYMPINEDVMEVIRRDLTCDTIEDFYDWYMSDIKVNSIAGLVGRYLYYHSNNPPKRL